MITADKYGKDITIFNRLVDKSQRREYMLPTIVRKASVFCNQSVSGGSSKQTTTSYVIRIPVTAKTGGKRYIDAKDYAKLTREEAAQYWTIQKSGVIAIGAVETSDSFYETGILPDPDIEVVRVTSFADNTVHGTRRVQHWRINGVG